VRLLRLTRSRLLIPRSFGKGRGSVARLNVHSSRPYLPHGEETETAEADSWNVYKLAAKQIRLGTFEAADERDDRECRSGSQGPPRG
jgi:hypothetical protein